MRKFAAAMVLSGLVLVLLGALCVPRLWAQAGGAKRKVPPKVFDKRVEDAFLKDVVKQHGEGTINDVLSGRAAVTTVDGGTTTTTGNGNPSSGWSKLISAETLENEIKSTINLVGPNVESKAKWNTKHRAVRNYYSTMAMCFGVIAQYDGAVKFQKDAVAIRDNLAKSAANSKVNDERAMIEAKKLLAELLELRGGGNVNLAPGGDGVKPYGVSEVSEVMKRMQISTKPEGVDGKGLEFWISAAPAFKAAKSDVIHEAELLGMMAKVLQDKVTFDQANDDNFAKFAKEVEDASAEIVSAAKSDNYDAARAASGKITKACTGCHGAFR
jgi:hypothetical protein